MREGGLLLHNNLRQNRQRVGKIQKRRKMEGSIEIMKRGIKEAKWEASKQTNEESIANHIKSKQIS